jgi:quercetin dioxygenase-like cupin family protein
MSAEDSVAPAIPRRTLLALLPAAALVDSAEGQDAATVQPESYKVVLNNNRVRALEFTSRPGFGICGIGRHSHPAHLTVLLSDARAKVTENGKTFEVSNKLGDVFWSEAVTHEVENIAGHNVRALLIEVKNV